MKRQGRNDPYYRQLFEPSRSSRGTTERQWGVSTPVTLGRRKARSSVGLLLFVAVTLFGLFVLPHLAINGHHYRFWLV